VLAMINGIVAENIWFSYSKRIKALQGASLRAHPGRVCVLLGANGSGKSTLLYIIAGLLKPDNGKVFYNGHDISKLGAKYRLKVGMLFQNPDDQIFNITVKEELAYGLRQLGFKGEELERRVIDTARKFRIDHLLNRSPYELSFGEKKIVMLAAVTIHEPEIIILDEPFANLGASYRRIITEFIEDMRRENRIIILATHSPFIALQLADIVVIIKQGKTIFSGGIKEFADKRMFEEADLEDPCSMLGLAREMCSWDS